MWQHMKCRVQAWRKKQGHKFSGYSACFTDMAAAATATTAETGATATVAAAAEKQLLKKRLGQMRSLLRIFTPFNFPWR